MRREQRLYHRIPKPTLVLRLVTSVDTAIIRDAERVKQGGPNAEAVRRRWDLETCAEFPGVNAVSIDTGGPLDETIRAATRVIWETL